RAQNAKTHAAGQARVRGMDETIGARLARIPRGLFCPPLFRPRRRTPRPARVSQTSSRFDTKRVCALARNGTRLRICWRRDQFPAGAVGSNFGVASRPLATRASQAYVFPYAAHVFPCAAYTAASPAADDAMNLIDPSLSSVAVRQCAQTLP